MKILKVVYNNSTDFIINIVDKFKDQLYIETYNQNVYKDRKKVYEIQEELASKNYPLLMFKDENLEIVGGIWSEGNPDWEKEIKRIIKL